MVNNGISVKEVKGNQNDEVSYFEILAELRLNRKKINMIYNIVKEQKLSGDFYKLSDRVSNQIDQSIIGSRSNDGSMLYIRDFFCVI